MTPSAPDQSTTQRLMKGAAWIMATRIIVNIITFASSIVLARLLIPEDFGLVALATGLGSIVSALTALPIGEALIRTRDVEEDHFDSAFTLGFIRAVALTFMLIAAAWPAAFVYDDMRLVPIMLVLALNALASGFYSARWPMIQKSLRFGPDFVVGTTSQIVSAISSILIAYYFKSYWAIVIPLALLQFLSVAITHFYAPYRPRLSFKRVPEILSFSVWMTLAGTLNALNARLDTLLIGGVLGQRAVGYYSYADGKATMPTRELSAPLLYVLFPGLATVQHDPVRVASAYKRVLVVIFAVCAPAGVGFALVSDQFVHSLLGDKWLPIIPIMQVIAVALACETLVVPVAPLAMATGHTRGLFTRNIAAFVTRAPLIILGLFLLGIQGVLIARIAAMICYVLIFMTFARNLSGVSVADQFRGCTRSFAALGIMVLCTMAFKAALPAPYALHVGALLASVLVGALSYTIGHLGLWYIAGRPQGPEAELLALAQGALQRRRAARQSWDPSDMISTPSDSDHREATITSRNESSSTAANP